MTLVSAEFLFFPLFFSALELIKTAIDKAGFTDKVVIGMDVAASEFYRDGKYDLDFKSAPDPERNITSEKLLEIYQSFVNDFPGTKELANGVLLFYFLLHNNLLGLII